MPVYRAPIQDYRFLLHELFEVEKQTDLPQCSEIARVDHWGFMWQGIGGTSFEIAPDADLFLDYRYRHVNASVESFSPSLGPVATHDITENVVMAGVRFYMFPAMEGPPPPAYYPPPQPQYQYQQQQQQQQNTMPPPQPPAGGSGGATSGGPQ